MKTLTQPKDTRSPLAKMRDEYLASADNDPSTLGADPMAAKHYLRNRLELAFLAGVDAARILAKKGDL